MSLTLPDLYKETLFESLGNPISLVNKFMYKNCILPVCPHYMNPEIVDYSDDTTKHLDRMKVRFSIEEYVYKEPKAFLEEKLLKKPLYNSYHRVCDPVEHFQFFLYQWVKSLEHKKVSKVLERCEVLINHYNTYVLSLCGFVIETVHGNSYYLQEVSQQREAITNKIMEFRKVCNDLKLGRNYSLT